jgi:hypothetical protein
MRRERLPDYNAGSRSNNWMVGVFLVIVFIIIALMFVLSSNVISEIPWLGKIIRPFTPFPTPTPTHVTVNLDDLFATPQKYTGQRVTVDGKLALPFGLLECPKNAEGESWCTVYLYGGNGKSSLEISLTQQNDAINSLTTDNQFRTSQSELLPDGSLARITGTVVCNNQGNQCKIKVDTIEASQSTATATPPPSTVPPTPTPLAQATARPLAPTIPACLPAQDVSLTYVGKNLCITGTVKGVNTVNNVSYIRFDDNTGSFYLLLYGWTWKEARPGACVQASGEVKKLGSSPVIVLGQQAPYSICP